MNIEFSAVDTQKLGTADRSDQHHVVQQTMLCKAINHIVKALVNSFYI